LGGGEWLGYPKVGANYYNAWWRDLSKGRFGISISPDDWTAPVPVGKPIEIDVTTTGACGYNRLCMRASICR